MASFAQRMQLLREENEWTQGDMAKRLGVSKSTVGMYELGKRSPDQETLVLIADIFGVSTDYLLCRTNDRNGKGTTMTIREAVEDHDFILWAKTRLLAAQAAAEAMLGDQAKSSRSKYENFDKFTREKQIEILEKGFIEVLKSTDGKFSMKSVEIAPEVKELVEKLKSLPEKDRQAVWETINKEGK